MFSSRYYFVDGKKDGTEIKFDYEITEQKIAPVVINPEYPVANIDSTAEISIANMADYEFGTLFQVRELTNAYNKAERKPEIVPGEWKYVGPRFELRAGQYQIRPVGEKIYVNVITDFRVYSTMTKYSIADVTRTVGDSSATIVCDYNYIPQIRDHGSNFSHLTINGIRVNSLLYTVKSGSTEVTLNSELVKNLKVGDYEVGFHYANGMHIEGILKIKEKVTTPYIIPNTGVR